MSKYTEAIESLKEQCNTYCPSDGCKDCYIVTAIEALEITDRLEQAEADVYNKCCEVCTSLKICHERCEMCDEASAWEDGYNQALADIRGEEE